MDGIESLECQIEGSFLIYEWKNVMDAHGFLGTQDIVKMDGFESSPILYTLFDHCDI